QHHRHRRQEHCYHGRQDLKRQQDQHPDHDSQRDGRTMRSRPHQRHFDRLTNHDEIMGLRHTSHLTWGVQFHPESVLTTYGKDILRNFLTLSNQAQRGRK
ncbi:MAG: hypothetical protein NC930_07235, partial [Candidatus Omnitrophica bacterium]|nr:hypothetical protein [Candidatus Omnitrophota bacterium]